MTRNRRILGIGALLAVLFWLGDTALDAWFFLPGSFWDLLIFRVPPHELYMRSVVVVLCLAAAFLLSRGGPRGGDPRGESDQRREHLERTNRVLEALREITRLVREARDPEELLSRASTLLVDSHGFRYAWVIQIRDGAVRRPLFFAGEGAWQEEMAPRIREGWMPTCARKALERGDTYLVQAPAEECEGCPQVSHREGWATLAAPLSHAHRNFGCLVISLPGDSATSSVEQALLRELGEELAIGLESMERSEKLNRLQESYDAVLATTGEAVITADMEGKIVLFNPGAERLFGYRNEEILGEHISILTPPHRLQDQRQLWRTILKDGTTWTETERLTKDGRLIPVFMSLTLQHDAEGNPVAMDAVLHDISHRLDTAREYAQLIDTAIDGFLVIAMDGRVLLGNEAIGKLLGYTLDELTELHVSDVDAFDSDEDVLRRLEAIRQAGSARFETQHRKKDGTLVDVEVSARYLPSGSPRIISFIRDIRERRRAEGALRESEERFREMAELLPEAVFEADLSLMLTYANQRAFELFGYTEEDFENGIWALDTLGPGDREMAARSFRDRMKGNDPGALEYTAVRKDGSTFPILFHASLIVRNGRAEGLRGIIVDLSEQKSTQEEIAASDRRFRNIIEASPMGVLLYELKEDGSLILEGANRSADRILSIDTSGLLGKSIEEAFPGLVNTEIPDRYREAATHGTPWRAEEVVYDTGGISGAFEVTAFQTAPGQMAVLFLDITHRKQAREALERSEERLRMATRSGRVGVWEYELATDTLQWDDLMYDLMGVDRESAPEGIERWRRIVHPDDLARAEREFMDSLRPPGKPLKTEFRIVLGDTGEVRHIRGMAGTIQDEEGRPLRAVGTNWDVTDEREAQEALRHSEEKFRSVVEQSNDAVYILFQNRFDLVNRRFCELTGVSKEEVSHPEFSFWELVSEKSRPLIRARQESRERGEEISDLYEFQIQRPGGRTVDVEASVTEIDYQGGKAILGILRDVTDHKQLQIQLNQAQKMESIGRLSGGVAHDLNNLLTPIIGYAELIRDEFPPEDERRDSAEEIVRAAFRSRDLVRQLLAFSRQQTLEFKSTDLNGLVRGFEKLLRRTIREDIEIHLIPGEKVPIVRADRGQIEQVLMNLAVNAQDAMPQGGTLHIETSHAEFDEEFAGSRPGVTPGKYALLSITDTGLGMDTETRDRIFEPFFTTKEKGRGTGLGLATVYGIVKQHGGNIWVYSEPGRGTTFKCYFPADESPADGEESGPPEDVDARGSETVMVVEDEELVRKLALTILRRKGYTVHSAEDAQDCLRKLETLDSPIHLLLTDVVLPGMNGKELYQRVSQHFPDIRVLFMSGYSDDVVTHRGVLEKGIAFIQKPFSVQALAQKVRDVLS